MTFTPPADTSVIMQSRGSEPVPNWIFATRLHRRRSLLRRFANMSILRVTLRMLHPAFLTPLYRQIVGIRLAQPLAIYAFSLNSLYRPPRGAIVARPGVCEPLLRALGGVIARSLSSNSTESRLRKRNRSALSSPRGLRLADRFSQSYHFARIFTCINTIRVPGDSDVIAIGCELIAADVTSAGINGHGTGLATHIASINRSLN